MTRLQIGDSFPEISVRTTQGPLSLPNAYAGKWLLLFSHPADFTPVCTTEFVALQQRAEDFAERDCELLGLSTDQLYSHLQWLTWIKDKLQVEIRFPIIADADGAIARELGFRGPAPDTKTIRGTYLIDPEGVIRAQLFYPPEVGRQVDELLRLIRALQTADREAAVVPADWPQNKLLGDRLLRPPPTTVDGVVAAREDQESLDWWFCPRPPESK